MRIKLTSDDCPSYHPGMRTTLDIDEPVLRDLRLRQKTEGKTMGRLASDLLTRVLRDDAAGKGRPPAFHWTAKAMGARLELSDREAIYDALEQADRGSVR
jgi:hypothetical protein